MEIGTPLFADDVNAILSTWVPEVKASPNGYGAHVELLKWGESEDGGNENF